MFSPEEVLLEHGLVGAFDTMALMHDEELAIIFMNNDEEKDHATSSLGLNLISATVDKQKDIMRISAGGDSSPKGVTYLELQTASQELAALLYHRFGVRKGDPVAILCHGYAAAEVTMTLTFYQLKATLDINLMISITCSCCPHMTLIILFHFENAVVMEYDILMNAALISFSFRCQYIL